VARCRRRRVAVTTAPTGRLVADDLRQVMTDGAFETSLRLTWDGAPAPAGVPGSGARIVVRVHDDDAVVLARRYADGTRPAAATALLPVLTIVAAASGRDLHVDAPVCAAALAGARRAAATVSAWFGWHDARPGAATEFDAPPTGAEGDDALFFSRGLDSMSSWIVLRDAGVPPGRLIALDWRDPPYATPGTEAILAGTRSAAALTGVPLSRVSTNARDWLDPLAEWTKAFGATLATTALALDGMVSRALITSSFPPGVVSAHGSHDDLDPLWSSAGVRVEHFHPVPGGRIDRARVVSTDAWACRWLKVCWERPGDGNCGVCRKCLLTMSAFHVIGALDRVQPAFDAPLAPPAIRTVTAEPTVVPLIAEVLAVYRDVAEGRARPAWTRRVRSGRRAAAEYADAWSEVLDATTRRNAAP